LRLGISPVDSHSSALRREYFHSTYWLGWRRVKTVSAERDNKYFTIQRQSPHFYEGLQHGARKTKK